MKDNRVTLLQAKRLKRMGYNNPSTAYLIGNTLVKYQAPNDWNHKRDYSNLTFPYISVPTCDEVIEWLYNKHNVYIDIIAQMNKRSFKYDIYRNDFRVDSLCLVSYKNINCVKRAAISKALTFIQIVH